MLLKMVIKFQLIYLFMITQFKVYINYQSQIMNNFSSRIPNNYNYNPSLNIPSDMIKPVKCLNPKLFRESSGKAMVQCISALPQAKQRCKQQLRINYLKGIIEKKVQNDKYRHLLNVQSTGNVHQPFFKQPLVPSQYLQPERNTIKENHAVTMPYQMGIQSNTNANHLNMSSGNNFLNRNIQGNSMIGGISRNQVNSNFISDNPFQNYNKTNNQQVNIVSQSPMMNQKIGFQNLPTLQRGNTFGVTNPQTNQMNSQFSNVPKTGIFQQNSIIQPNKVNSPLNPTQTSSFGVKQINSNINQNTSNPFQSISNMSTNPGTLYSNQNSFNGLNQFQSSSNNPNFVANSTQGQPIQGNISQNQTNPLFSQSQNSNQAPNGVQNHLPIQNNVLGNSKIQQNTNMLINASGQVNNQTAHYAAKYPMLYKIKQQQLNRLKDSNIKQSIYTIQTLNKNIKDFEQNKYNIWNQITLNKFDASQNNQQGRRYITHILKRMTDQKMIDQKVLRDSISTLYKFIYGEGVFNQLMNQYKNKSTKNSLNGIKTNGLLEFVQNQPKHIRLDQILGKSTDQTSYSVRGRFNSLQNFDEKMQYQKNQIRNNLQNTFRQQQQQQQKQKQFIVRYVPTKKKEDKLRYSTSQLEKIGNFIKQDRHSTFKTIMVQLDELPVLQNYKITPSLSQLSKMMKNQIKSVPHVKLQNQWGVAQFLAPISLFKKNIKQCITINRRQVFIHDEEWTVRLCRITFKRFEDFGQMGEQDRKNIQRQIKKWCRETKIQLIQINQVQGKVVVQF